MSRSTELLAWTRERFRLAVYGPLVLLLEAARLALAPRPAESFVWRAALALVALFALRLWDDLASVRRDTRDHPERVLSRAGTTLPFVAAAGATFGAAAVLALALGAGSTWRLAILGAIGAYHAALYRVDAREEQRGLFASFAVLVKYPMLAALLAAGDGVATTRGAVVLVTLFGCFGVYEILHDPPLRSLPSARAALLASALATMVGGGLLAALALSHGLIAGAVQGGLALVAALVTVAAVRATTPDGGPGVLRWAVFVAVAAELALVATWRM